MKINSSYSSIINAPSAGCGYKRTKLLIVTFAEMREIKSLLSNQQLENYKFHFLEPREYAWADMDGHAIIANIGDDNFPSIEFKIASGIYKLAFDECSLHFDFRQESFVGILEEAVEQKLKEFNIADEVIFSIELLPPYELTSSMPDPASINFTQEFPNSRAIGTTINITSLIDSTYNAGKAILSPSWEVMREDA